MNNSISAQQLETLKKQTKICVYDGLVLNLNGFSHPGGANLLSNRLGTDITDGFNQTKHSLNAKLFLRNMTIGRLEGQTPKGQMFSIEQQKIVNTYDTLNRKLNLNEPLSEQIQKFTREEFLNFVNYPKLITPGQNLQINSDPKDDEPGRTEFWVNIPLLSTVFIVLLYLSLTSCRSLFDVAMFGLCFGIAIFKWTLIEYYFHRVKLHKELDLVETAKPEEFAKLAKSHLIHHAFPNYPSSIVIQIKTIAVHLGVLIVLYTFLFSWKAILFMTTGLIFSTTAYDCLHYFFHFGWETTWEPLARLKRNHLKHHYKHTDRGFGVTNSFWDRVFGTQHI